MEYRNSGLDEGSSHMSFSNEYEQKLVRVTLSHDHYAVDSGSSDEKARDIAESKLEGFEAIHAFYDDSCDTYEVLCVKKKEKDSSE